MGRSTLGLGYAVTLADLAIAPFTPSNTGRSAGVIFPIVRSIPALYGSAPGPTARRIGAYLMWTAFAATAVTSSMFLTALAPNLLAVGLIRKEIALDITWSQWLLGFLPVGALLIASCRCSCTSSTRRRSGRAPMCPRWARCRAGPDGKALVPRGRHGRPDPPGVRTLGLRLAAWINATTAILAVVSLMVILRVLEWEDVVGNRAAWDTVIYFATLMTLADGLNRVGVVTWAARGVSRPVDRHAAPRCALIVLVVVLLRGPLRLRQPDRPHGGRLPRAPRGGSVIPRHAREGLRARAGLLDRADGRDHALCDRPGPGLLRQRVHPPQGFLDPGIRVRADLPRRAAGGGAAVPALVRDVEGRSGTAVSDRRGWAWHLPGTIPISRPNGRPCTDFDTRGA